MNKKSVCYRVGTGACLSGYVDVSVCTDEVPVFDGTTNAVVAGARVVPCGDCPAEVVVVSTVAAAAAPVAPVPEFDREVGSWCDPVTGAPVAVVTTWGTTAAPATAPTVLAYNLDGTAYAGAVSALVKCAADGQPDIETLDQVVCDGTSSFTHTTFVDTATLAAVGSLWRDASGAVIAAPAGPFTLGPCVPAEVVVPFTGLTDAQLRAAAVAVTGPLTNAELRAAPVAVTGPLTLAELDALVVDVNVTNPGPTAAQIAAAVDVALRATSLPVTQTTATGHHETVVLCDPANAGAPVVLTNWWLDTAANTGMPYVTVTNPNGTSWAGTVSTLVDCSRVPVATATATVALRSYAEPSTLARTVSAAPSQAIHTPNNLPLSVKLVDEPTERETVVLCNPTTGAPVIVETWWRDAAVPGATPMVTAYNPDGTVYAGAVSALVDCSRVAAAPAVYTPSVLTATAAGTVAAGARSISIFNRGTANGTVDGDTILPNMGLSFEAPDGGTLAALAYDATGTTFTIAEVR